MTDTADIARATEQAHRLAAILDEEFAALRAQDIAAFEAMQDNKQNVLTALSQIAETHGTTWNEQPEWAVTLGLLQDCRDAHRRNETILRRQLDVVRMSLAALTRDDAPALYDHLGPSGTRAQRAAKAYGE